MAMAMLAQSDLLSIIIPQKRYGNAVVKPHEIQAIIAHRVRGQTEQYLVKWKWRGDPAITPHSWHPIYELAGDDGLQHSSTNSCLRYVQVYLESLQLASTAGPLAQGRKRKSPEVDHTPHLSPFDRSRSSSSAQSDVLLAHKDEWDELNCTLCVSDGAITMIPTSRVLVDTSTLPTEAMQHCSRNSRYNIAASKIRSQFIRGLQSIRGKRVHLVNTRDMLTPSLGFRFIDSHIYREGIAPLTSAEIKGCGSQKTRGQMCRPNMGGNCGCEYTRACECLEFAMIDRKRLNDEEALEWKSREQELLDIVMGLPKRFPYSKDTNLLVAHYLEQRWPIYECNENCACGPGCKSRVVQRGRTVGLEVFRTKNRGWGLRATEPLRRGQFIDTYPGEVISREEANRRAGAGPKGKDSYLFPLDKFAQPPISEHLYEIDGEFFGGPSRFINHSCDPNCVVYVVKMDQNPWLYQIAFFAYQDIVAGQELTFNYRDGEDDAQADEREGTDDNVEENSIPCLCGAYNCRKWLWK